MTTYIFTDGASKGNPGAGGYGAVVFDGSTVSEYGGREAHTTNNRMELRAAIAGLQAVDRSSPVVVFSDSSYVINGISKWVDAWEKNGWKTKAKEDVLNVDLWKELRDVSREQSIRWVRVPGHSDVAGNERANDIAEDFARGSQVSLYQGAAQSYTIRLLEGDKPLDRKGAVSPLIKKESPSKRSGKAYSYVSVVDGVVRVHSTWEECKKHVTGKNARFRKALTKDEELQLIREFS